MRLQRAGFNPLRFVGFGIQVCGVGKYGEIVDFQHFAGVLVEERTVRFEVDKSVIPQQLLIARKEE